MAEFNDFFKSHAPMDAPPLNRLRDTENVPDLRRYTVGDLRAWIRETSPGMPSVLPKGIIRTPAQLRAGVVGTDQLANRSVTNRTLSLTQTNALPAGAQEGDVILYVPAANVVWVMVAGPVVSGKRRWYFMGGPNHTIQNPGYAPTLPTSPLALTSMSYATPYAGMWNVTWGALTGMTSASGSNGQVQVALYRDGGAINPATAYDWHDSVPDWRDISETCLTPGTAGGNFLLYAWAYGTATRQLQRPWMSLHPQCLDGPI